VVDAAENALEKSLDVFRNRDQIVTQYLDERSARGTLHVRLSDMKHLLHTSHAHNTNSLMLLADVRLTVV
jgi:hypothetical protein